MVTPELIEYIKKCREQNIPDEQIKTALKEQGWEDEDINAGLLHISQSVESIQSTLTAESIEEKPKKKFLVPIIIIIGILIIGGGAFAYFQFFAKESNAPEYTNLDNNAEQAETENIKNLSAEKICNKIEDKDMAKWCLARMKGDINLCNNLDNYKSFCISDIMVNNAVRNKSAENCGNNGNCYTGVAVITQNSDLCKNIKNEYSFNDCLIGVAVFNKNINFCENIDSDYYKNLCKAVLGGDSSNCSQFKDNEMNLLSCKNAIAVLKNDPSLCGDPIEMLTDYCYESIAIRTGDSSVCENLKEFKPNDYKLCVGKVNKNSSVCEELNDADLFGDACFNELASSIKGLKIYDPMLHYVSLSPQN